MNLALIGGILANDRSGKGREWVREKTVGLLADLSPSGSIVTPTHIILRRIAAFMRSHRSGFVAHEKVIYFLQALAIMYGAEDGPPADNEALALLMLMANDYLDRWNDPIVLPMSDLEDAVAGFVHVTRFNSTEDSMQAFARASMLFAQAPPRGPLSDRNVWRDIQLRAFGMSASRYFRSFLGVLFLESHRWGLELPEGKHATPLIDLRTWLKDTRLSESVGRDLLGPLTIDRQRAREMLMKDLAPDGLPSSPTLFYRFPFISVGPSTVVATSPWAVREYLRGGLWGRLRSAVPKTAGGSIAWLGAFGDIFERWCRRVARSAAASPRFVGRALISRKIGSRTEFEDIVIVAGERILLCSVKARLLPEEHARGAGSRAHVLRWLESFLFDPSTDAFRMGALRRLHEKVQAIRVGSERRLPRDATVYPVVVTFERLGENAVLYKWVSERCARDGLLQGPKVRPTSFCTIADFEALMTLCAEGVSPFDVIDEAQASDDRRVSTAIDSHIRKVGKRLPMLERIYTTEGERLRRSVFGAR